jgi:glycogen synthase
VQHLDVARNRGNGFLFENHDSGGLLWAIGEAMHFYRRQETVRSAQIQRIMRESTRRFNIEVMADQYLALYAKLLGRPLATPSASVPTGGSAPRPGCRRDKPDLAAVP